jgi:glucose-6-phosphate isomerase
MDFGGSNMKKGLTLDLSKVAPYLHEYEVGYMEDMVLSAHNKLHNKTGAGSDFLGWVDLPVNYDKDEFARIKKAAEKIKSNSDALIVIGIGGSYLGARAAIEMLTNNFHNCLPASKRKAPAVFYVGNNISSTYMAELLEAVDGLDKV